MAGGLDTSLSNRVYASIREGILNGKYKEHDELREITLGSELGVSRTPVREALRQLELEGLVEILPNRGAYVRGINEEDVFEIYSIRSLLEGLAARWAAEHITKEQLDELEEVIFLSEYHMKKEEENVELMAQYDSRFHEILYEASGSRFLSKVLKEYHEYVKLARKMSVQSPDRARKSVREHKQILIAIQEKDPDMAEQLANEHIRHVMQNLKMRT